MRHRLNATARRAIVDALDHPSEHVHRPTGTALAQLKRAGCVIDGCPDISAWGASVPLLLTNRGRERARAIREGSGLVCFRRAQAARIEQLLGYLDATPPAARPRARLEPHPFAVWHAPRGRSLAHEALIAGVEPLVDEHW